MVVYDIEVFRNYLLAGFQLPDGTSYQYDHTDPLAIRSFIQWVRRQGMVIGGFNSRHYDDRVLSEFLDKETTEAAYEASVNIIVHGVPPWTYPDEVFSIDLMQILPGRIGLKKIGVCLGHKTLKEMPVDVNAYLSTSDIRKVIDYNINDLLITRELQKVIQPELDLRSKISDQYNIDLRSRGEAAIAEQVLITETRADANKAKTEARIQLDKTQAVVVNAPTWWGDLPLTKYPSLQRVLDLSSKFYDKPIPVLYDRLAKGAMDATFYLGDRFYRLGVGGLHSVDGAGTWLAGDHGCMYDIDVASYYPNIMVTQNLWPRHWVGERSDIGKVFSNMLERRLKAKKEGDKVTNAVFKIVLNGTYGKTSDPFSALCDPWVTASVTIIGQMSLLVLIAMLHDRNVSVVSANTDGITVWFKSNQGSQKKIMEEVVDEWDKLTGFEMEYTQYQSLMQLDVNNYLALTTDGKLKTKGRFSAVDNDLRHTPNHLIVAKAIQAKVKHGIPIESTIYCSTNIQDFLLTQQVKGDFTTSWKGHPLGKMLRWYKSNSLDAAPIMRHPGKGDLGNEGVVGNADNANPLENLPSKFPLDVDYHWYINKAYDLYNRAVLPKTPGGNRVANELIESGLHPALVDPDKRPRSRARPPIGSVDFSSIANNQKIGVLTGEGIIAQVNAEGETVCLFRVSKPYPTKTRPKILKDCGFELIYGAVVPMGIGTSVEITKETNLDEYYTPAELKRARISH